MMKNENLRKWYSLEKFTANIGNTETKILTFIVRHTQSDLGKIRIFVCC